MLYNLLSTNIQKELAENYEESLKNLLFYLHSVQAEVLHNIY